MTKFRTICCRGLVSSSLARMGLHFPQTRWPDLQRGIAESAKDLGFENATAAAVRLMSGPLTKNQIDVLADHLTVGETYFFRDPRSFEILAGSILPELIRLRHNDQRRIRIWSAGVLHGRGALHDRDSAAPIDSGSGRLERDAAGHGHQSALFCARPRQGFFRLGLSATRLRGSSIPAFALLPTGDLRFFQSSNGSCDLRI